jgi:chitosanase
MITELQKRTCKSIVRVFETGKAKGDYGAIARTKGDTGGISYGISQASLMSGNLCLLLQDYCLRVSDDKARMIAPYMIRLKNRDRILNEDAGFYKLLKQLAKDPIMQEFQDQFFDSNFWVPAQSFCNHNELKSALSHAVVYDSFIQGAFGTVRKEFPERTPADGGEERAWITAYCAARRLWLASRSPVLNRTTYRPQVFQQLISQDNWDLNLPLKIRGAEIREELL